MDSKTEKPLNSPAKRPDWIKVRGLSIDVQRSMSDKLRGCNTVCLSAKCPNIGECFSHGVATFMIGGSICTRSCKFCGVKHGQPEPLDPKEPQRVAEAVRNLGLAFVVITSVTRDDLPDGAASHYSSTVGAIRKINPATGIEVLIPDFGGDVNSLKIVLDSNPDILNHNIETIQRLTPIVRSKAEYDRSLGVLRNSFEIRPDIPTKSGMMIGLGEDRFEVIETLADLRKSGCRIVTIGQYLQPRSGQELPVSRYWTPAEFEEIKKEALGMGFDAVASGPFVRSSYFAEQLSKGVK
ncbi:MAG: lipoyl synthase [bacterium]|nr:lipoyl synthase [bacterium]